MINLILHILHSTCRIAYSILHILHRYSTCKIHSTFFFAISVFVVFSHCVSYDFSTYFKKNYKETLKAVEKIFSGNFVQIYQNLLKLF